MAWSFCELASTLEVTIPFPRSIGWNHWIAVTLRRRSSICMALNLP
jgi:hypothetical protein